MTNTGMVGAELGTNAVAGATAAWSRIDLDGEGCDVLDVTSGETRDYTFVWPARTVVQVLDGRLAYSERDLRVELAVGAVLVLDRFSSSVRVHTSPGGEFRVFFEAPSPTTARAGRGGQPYVCAWSSTATAPAEVLAAALAGGFAEPARRLVGPVARVRDYIEGNVHATPGLDVLGARFGIDRCHLCRSFQKSVGLPPFRYLSHLRVARARELLALGLDCTAVAHAVGFCDQSHLTRSFKELTGTTPGAYARACRGAGPASVRRVA